MINTLIFDWGGVFTIGKQTMHIAKLIEKKNNLPKNSVYPEIDKLMVLLNLNSMSLEEFTKETNDKFKLKIPVKEMENIFEKAIIPNNELINLLKKLKKDFRIILFSNNNKPTAKILREKHRSFLDLFEKVYFSSEFNTAKPKTEFFELMIKDANLNPKKCIFIDDKEKNIKAAKEVGIRGIVFLNNDQLKEALTSFSIKLDNHAKK